MQDTCKHSNPPSPTVSLSKVAVTCGPLRSKNMERKMPEVNNSSVLNDAPFRAA